MYRGCAVTRHRHYERRVAHPRTFARRFQHAIIETPKNSAHKYALKNEYGIIAFSEVLPAGMHWPYDYGFVPQTLADDGDPLDILVLTDDALFSGCLIEARVVGSVRLSKNGVENDRLYRGAIAKCGCTETDRWLQRDQRPSPSALERDRRLPR
jgi:Inorganic pyrophosphatase